MIALKVAGMCFFTFIGMVWMIAYTFPDHVKRIDVPFDEVAWQKTWIFLMGMIFHGIALFIATSL